MTLVLGLTGNVASGKSTIRRLFAARGASVLDADAVVHELYRPKTPTTRALVRAFGRSILSADGAIDRQRLAARTMGRPAATRRLEAVVHPAVTRTIERWIAAQRRSRRPLAVIEASLTYEAGTDGRHDLMIFVDAPKAIRRRRAIARGLSGAEFDRREARMWPAIKKRQRAAIVISNRGDERELRAAVDWIGLALAEAVREPAGSESRRSSRPVPVAPRAAPVGSARKARPAKPRR